MPVGAKILKIVTTAGTIAAGGAAGVMVIANDPKPATAPLQPHVAGTKQPAAGATPTPLPPLPPSCGNLGGGNGKPVTLTPQQQSELQQLRQTPAAQRRALLLTFPAADRIQIAAYQKQHAKPKSGPACKSNPSNAPAITPDITNGGNNTAPINTYVS
jgi:hypothetical protein